MECRIRLTHHLPSSSCTSHLKHFHYDTASEIYSSSRKLLGAVCDHGVSASGRTQGVARGGVVVTSCGSRARGAELIEVATE